MVMVLSPDPGRRKEYFRHSFPSHVDVNNFDSNEVWIEDVVFLLCV